MRLLRKRHYNSNGCWIWTGARDRYGFIRYGDIQTTTHRLAAILWLLDFDDKLVVRHKCRNGFCFNPDHLLLGSQSDNIRDQVTDGTHYEKNKTKCPRNHEYTAENTYIQKYKGSIKRQCKQCRWLRNNGLV